MSIDIQVNSNFLQNPKIVKLRRRLGAEAVVSLLQLWCHARLDRPDGDLGVISNEDLEIAAGWNGDHDIFADTIADLGLTDRHGDASTTIHDWHEHETFSVKSERRSAAGKANAIKRWSRMPIHGNGIVENGNGIENDMPYQCDTKKSDAPDQTRPDQKDSNAAPPATPTTTPRDREKHPQSIDEIIADFEASPAYKGIDVRRECAKAAEWIKNKKDRRLTRRYLVNWLNKCEPTIDFDTNAPSQDPKRELHLQAERCHAKHLEAGTRCTDIMRVAVPNLAHCQDCPARAEALKREAVASQEVLISA